MIDDSNENAIAADIAGLPTDVRDMELSLSQDEKIRTISLMMGIRYHVDTIIKDPRYLELMISKEKEAKFSNDPEQEHWHLRPSTARGVVGIALEFEAYLRGYHSAIASVKFGGEEIAPGAGRAQGDMQTET
jgi:hypothetical protein